MTMGGSMDEAGHRARTGARATAGARRAALAAIGVLAMVVAACGVRIGSIDLRFGNVDLSFDSGIGIASTVVVREPNDWTRLWLDHDSRILPSRPLPFVDFGRDIIVAVFLGQRPDRCHGVRIERVLLFDDSRIIVRFREVVSRSGAACAPALSYPAVIVRIPFTDLPVRFEQLGALYID